MKKLTLLVLLMLLVGDLRAQETVNISFFSVPPHIVFNSENKKISGVVYDLIEKHIAPEMGVKFVWDASPSNIPRQLKSLEVGKKDASALFVYTPDRAAKFAFTDTPYFLSRPAIIVLNDNPLKTIEKVEDILHMKIGYASKTYVSPFMRDKRIKFDLHSSPNFIELNVKKLIIGRIDAAYAPDSSSLLTSTKSLAVEEKVRLINLPEKPSSLYLVFSKKKQALKKKYDTAFKKIDGRKKYMEILENYLDVSKLQD